MPKVKRTLEPSKITPTVAESTGVQRRHAIHQGIGKGRALGSRRCPLLIAARVPLLTLTAVARGTGRQACEVGRQPCKVGVQACKVGVQACKVGVQACEVGVQACVVILKRA